MIATLGLPEMDEETWHTRVLQDKVRGSLPVLP
jgi:hypothetical protein